ncbi:MAG: hypothetical protein ABH823_05890, partial [bacterium]
MEIFAIILSVATLAAIVFLITQKKQPEQNNQAVEIMQKQMEEIRSTITKVVAENQTILQKVNSDFTNSLQDLNKNT